MSAANPNPIEKSMVSVLVAANAGGGVAIAMSIVSFTAINDFYAQHPNELGPLLEDVN
jgi:hypothetical protein